MLDVLAGRLIAITDESAKVHVTRNKKWSENDEWNSHTYPITKWT